MTPAKPIVVAIDYSVLDHLHRIQAGSYKGAHASSLGRFRKAAEDGRVHVWIAEITPVEMLHGREKVAADSTKLARATANDEEKKAIGEMLRARYLAYPCSKLDDTYSRLDLSFRLAGPDTEDADRLEQRLLAISGVSPGDARQLVSCAFRRGTRDAGGPTVSVSLEWFTAEDTRLIDAISLAVAAGTLPELAHLRFGSTAALVAAHPGRF